MPKYYPLKTSCWSHLDSHHGPARKVEQFPGRYNSSMWSHGGSDSSVALAHPVCRVAGDNRQRTTDKLMALIDDSSSCSD